jgi:hypothetical protein
MVKLAGWGRRMKIAYFVHDLNDAAGARRVRRLQAGGAEPIVLGFHSSDVAPQEIAGAPAIGLGRIDDARLTHRARATALAALGVGRQRGALRGTDVIVACGLEMLVVADAARRACGLAAKLVYQCLDVHPLKLSLRRRAEAVRVVERRLMRRASLLVSSEAAMEDYFEPVQGVGTSLFIETLRLEDRSFAPEPVDADDARAFVRTLASAPVQRAA